MCVCVLTVVRDGQERSVAVQSRVAAVAAFGREGPQARSGRGEPEGCGERVLVRVFVGESVQGRTKVGVMEVEVERDISGGEKNLTFHVVFPSQKPAMKTTSE